MDIFTQLTGIVFTGITFWIAMFVIIGLFVASYFNSSAFLGLVAIGASAIIFTSTEWNSSFIWLIENPIIVIGSILGYIVIGGLWSIFDWYLYVNRSETKEMIRKRIEVYQESVYDGLIRNEIKELEKNGTIINHQNFKKHYLEIQSKLKSEGKLTQISLNEFLSSDSNPLNIGKYKWRFISKMAYWPISIIIVLFKDILSDIFNKIYESLGNLYNKIAVVVIQKIFETRE